MSPTKTRQIYDIIVQTRIHVAEKAEEQEPDDDADEDNVIIMMITTTRPYSDDAQKSDKMFLKRVPSRCAGIGP